jgi:hypothetical protein
MSAPTPATDTQPAGTTVETIYNRERLQLVYGWKPGQLYAVVHRPDAPQFPWSVRIERLEVVPPTMSTATAAQQIITAIGVDVAMGCMPWDVPDFSALHDFVDANMYLDEVMVAAGWVYDPASDEQTRWANDVVDLVNTALNGGSRPSRWETDPDGYHAWLADAKHALRASRAAAFGLTTAQMATHDGSRS